MLNFDVHEIDVEILQENKHSVSHPPPDTVYVIKTSGSTGTKIPSRSDAIAKEVIKMIVVFKNAPKVALLTVISIVPISEDAVLRLIMDSKTTFDNKQADDILLIISNPVKTCILNTTL